MTTENLSRRTKGRLFQIALWLVIIGFISIPAVKAIAWLRLAFGDF